MKEKLPPKTGLDFGAMMGEIDDQEELKKESENVKELLGQVKKAASELEASFETMVIELSEWTKRLRPSRKLPGRSSGP